MKKYFAFLPLFACCNGISGTNNMIEDEYVEGTQTQTYFSQNSTDDNLDGEDAKMECLINSLDHQVKLSRQDSICYEEIRNEAFFERFESLRKLIEANEYLKYNSNKQIEILTNWLTKQASNITLHHLYAAVYIDWTNLTAALLNCVNIKKSGKMVSVKNANTIDINQILMEQHQGERCKYRACIHVAVENANPEITLLLLKNGARNNVLIKNRKINKNEKLSAKDLAIHFKKHRLYRNSKEKCVKLDEIIKIINKYEDLPASTAYPSLKNDDGTDRECSICLEQLTNGETVCLLACDHFFHENCKTKWEKERDTCPYCRNPLKVEISNVIHHLS